MQRYILRRLLQGLVILVLVATIVFFLGRLTGNPVDLMLPEDATKEDRQSLIETLGLDGPVHVQFGIFLAKALRGDLGDSIRHREPAVRVFFSRLPNTLMIVQGAVILALIRRSIRSRGGAPRHYHRRISGAIAVWASPPPLLAGILLIYIFSVQLSGCPRRMGSYQHYVLPTITLCTFLLAGFMRLIRSSMLEILDSEFVKLARIKGLSETIVVCKHCLRNALIPVLTIWGVFMGGLVTGAIVTETVFAWPGIGRLTYEAVIFRDYPLLQAAIIMDAVLILFINLIVDILYAYVDPRIRLAD